MSTPAIPLPLQGFIDDELARAPLLVDELLQQTLDEPLRFAPHAGSEERRAAMAQRDALQRCRPQMVRAFAQTLREEVGSTARHQAAGTRGLRLQEADELSLSLVEDGEVELDVELQRALVLIHSTAEYELRELGSFTSALVGDLNVAHDTNPLRPEAYARALVGAARASGRPAGEQLALVHGLAMPLAQALRKAYASAAGRLEDQGVRAATHRTIVLPPGTAAARPRAPAPPPQDLHALRDSMPMPLDTADPPPAPEAAPARAAPAAGAAVDQQLIELLTRLFDAILADRLLPPDLQRLLSRLQNSALRVALRDPGMLDSSEHPVWTFMDRLAFDLSRHDAEPERRDKLLRHAEGLVDHIVREPQQDAALYRWGLGRLDAFAGHTLARLCSASQSQIDNLRTLTLLRQGASAPRGASQPAALDVGMLDTVPAELMHPGPQGRAPAGPPCALPPLEPGDWLHLFLQGQWRELLLLWTDAGGQAWLFREPGGRPWALKRSALERLNDAGLAEPMEPSSLLQHAAQQVAGEIIAQGGTLRRRDAPSRAASAPRPPGPAC